MRKQWFGDSRDYAKWNFLYSEASQDLVLCYIAMSRPDELATHIHPEVKAFFERYKDLALVGELFPNRFYPFLRSYEQTQRDSYFTEASDLIKSAQSQGAVVIFIDPDTGIEPHRSANSRHLRLNDLKFMASLLRAPDKLIVYQHAWRKPSWIDDSVEHITAQSWSSDYVIRAHYDKLCAWDVCFLIIERRGTT